MEWSYDENSVMNSVTLYMLMCLVWRMFVGGVPQSSVTPEVKELSDTEVMLRWRLPPNHSRVPVISYHLQYKHLCE